ncbi:MAG: hypothetical protein MZV64_22730 [Ignavibacteriales bacterium]|nr:hypothetical protein [Ignavibacteriales bacterium]
MTSASRKKVYQGEEIAWPEKRSYQPSARSASWAAPGSTRSRASRTGARSGCGRPSARPPVPTSSGRSRAAGSPSWPATAGATSFCPPRSTYRANIFGFKKLGVERIISVNSVGSLRGGRSAPATSSCRTSSSTGPAGRTPSSATASSPTSAWASRSAPSSPASSTTTADRPGPPGPPRRHLHLHRRPGLLDQGRVAGLPGLGRGRHRHDRRDRGPALPRGRDLLRDAEPGHRLRRLARDRGAGHGRAHPPEPGRQHRQRQGRDQEGPGRRSAAHGAPACDCGSSLRNTIVTAPAAIPAATRKKLGLLVDKYLR